MSTTAGGGNGSGQNCGLARYMLETNQGASRTGKIAEVIIYGRNVFSGGDGATINAYLKARYGTAT